GIFCYFAPELALLLLNYHITFVVQILPFNDSLIIALLHSGMRERLSFEPFLTFVAMPETAEKF
ncbi:hypothetical protein, partial [Pseudoalteromonas sp.]|uniref:hypothetical protein n=1 Tax=Pseudoalteromonas sp. TaxID=53249 RepID=UPI00260194C6